MAKFPKNISKKEQEELFVEFAQALASLRSPVEMAQFIKDLLSEPEAVMLARRLQIAKLLYSGLNYREIKNSIKVSFGTIARVQTWMQIYGDGYRTVLERTKKKDTNKQPDSLSKIKKRYPLYFWPQSLLDEIVRSSNNKQKRRLRNVLNQLKEKTALSQQLEKLLNNSDF